MWPSFSRCIVCDITPLNSRSNRKHVIFLNCHFMLTIELFFAASLFSTSSDLGTCGICLEHYNTRYARFSMAYGSLCYIKFALTELRVASIMFVTEANARLFRSYSRDYFDDGIRLNMISCHDS